MEKRQNIHGTEKSAQAELAARKAAFPTRYASDRVFPLPPCRRFVGTYYEYKLFLAI